MELKSVRIRGFRSIKDQRIDFKNRCQILVGVNESGKTNVLRALRLVDAATKTTLKDRRTPLDSEPADLVQEVDFEFAWTEEEYQAYEQAVLAHFLVKNPGKTRLHGVGADAKTVTGHIRRIDTPLVWINLEKGSRSIGCYTKLGSPVADGWYTRPADVTGIAIDETRKIEDFKFIYAPDFPDIPVDKLKPLLMTEVSSVCAGEIKGVIESKIPKCVYWTYEDKYLLPSSVEIGAFAENPESCVPLQQMFLLAGIKEIKKEIEQKRKLGTNAFRNLLERVARKSSDHVRQIWQEYKNIEIKLEANGEQIDCSVVDHQNRYDFADRSDGFKRFVSFLLVLSAQARTQTLTNTLILIDEAEIGLHPSGVKYLRDELIKLAEANYVVASTHSIFMIDRAHIGRHLIVRKKSETTELIRVDQTNVFEEEVVYNALNYSVFESLAAVNLIFEGWRDKKLFEIALSKDTELEEQELSALKSTGRCHLQGVNDAGRVVPMLELADRKYLVLSDSDEAAKQAQKKFKGSGTWLTYANLGATDKKFITSEDFISASAFNPLLAKIALGASTQPLVLTDEQDRPPRVQQIRSWLQSAIGLEGEALKKALDKLKDDCFVALKRQSVLPEYLAVLGKLAKKLPN